MNTFKLNQIINESVRRILNENARDQRVQDYLKSRGYEDYDARMEVITAIRHDIYNAYIEKRKFLLGLCRMFCDRQLDSEEKIHNVDNALRFIHIGGHADEFDENLNGRTPDELHEMFREASKQWSDNDRERSDSQVFNGGSRYKIIPIKSFEEARQYGKFFPDTDERWCVTKQKSAYDTYTKGGKRFYFCLRDDCQSFNPEAKDNTGAPLNEYGLSMISINVDMNGDLVRVTTRYNHEYNGENNPGLETPEQVEKVLNLPFYQTFKPYTREELHSMGIILFDEVQGLLDAGTPLKKIFNKVGKFYDGFALVKLNEKCNFITQEGRLLSTKWFDEAGDFSEGFARVKLNGKWNFITQEGRLLSTDGFDYANVFCDGFARVKLNGKWNFITQEGRLLSTKWFDSAWDFSEGFAVVNLNGKYNFINKEGRLLSADRFDWANSFSDGFAKVRLNGKWNFINKEGRLLSTDGFDWAEHFSDGFVRVELNGKYNFINQEGRLLSAKRFDYVRPFRYGFAVVRLNDKYNYITQEGKLLSADRFDYAWDFDDGFARVNLNGKYNYINKEGKLLSTDWFNGACNFWNGFAEVVLNYKRYYIDKFGRLHDKRPSLQESRKRVEISESDIRMMVREAVERLSKY